MKTACHRLSSEVRAHPLISLGVAVGVGALLVSIAGRAATGPRRPWLARLASELSEQSHDAGDRLTRSSHLIRKNLRAASSNAGDALRVNDLEQVARAGRKWLRSKLV